MLRVPALSLCLASTWYSCYRRCDMTSPCGMICIFLMPSNTDLPPGNLPHKDLSKLQLLGVPMGSRVSWLMALLLPGSDSAVLSDLHFSSLTSQ